MRSARVPALSRSRWHIRFRFTEAGSPAASRSAIDRQPGEPEWHGEAYFVSPEYLRTMRIPLLRGRNILPSDTAGSATVCLIDAKLAQRFFANQDTIGHEIAMYRGWARIVGVVAAVRATTLEEGSRPVVYYLWSRFPFSRRRPLWCGPRCLSAT